MDDAKKVRTTAKSRLKIAANRFFLIFQTGLFKNIFTIKSQLGYLYHRSLVKTFQIKEITFECVTRLSILTQIKITFK